MEPFSNVVTWGQFLATGLLIGFFALVIMLVIYKLLD